MAQAKMMNEAPFEKLVKEINSQGELIRTRQDEKQSVMNEFDKEKRRFTVGKISRATLTSSVVKTNKELSKLDSDIKAAMRKATSLSNRMNETLLRQEPKAFKASESGFRLDGEKKKSAAKKKTTTKRKAPVKKSTPKKKVSTKRKPVPSKATLAKEKALDKKYSKK